MDKPFPAYQGDEPFIFVCYAHDDASIVYPEISWLHQQGFRVWYDEGIPVGEEFPERIANAIGNATHLLFYISPRSVASRHCRDEVYFALQHTTNVVAAHIEATELPPGLELSTGTIQALLRYDTPSATYREKLAEALSDTGAAAQHAHATPGDAKTRMRRFRNPTIAVAAIAAVITLGLATFQFLQRQEDERWAREQAIPQIEALIETGWRDSTDAHALALRAKQIIPNDPQLEQLFAASSLAVDVMTDPPGARVYAQEYDEPDSGWLDLGTTPIEDQILPIGIFRWRLEMAGYDSVEAAASTWELSPTGNELLVGGRLYRTLDAEGSVPEGMVRVAGAEIPAGTLGDFFIDRFEVTNAEFKQFVDAGAYQDPRWWHHEFVKNGEPRTFDEAMALFVDQTGRPGPATWSAGDYSEGQTDYPVTGISWYEAHAYATFVGHELPTGPHWGLARGEATSLVQWPQLGGYAILAPFSNFDRNGPVPVGSLPGITAYGVYDMAGNVREWCWNETPSGRLIRGGAWDDNHYQFAEPAQAPAIDRSATNGFRTVMYPAPENIPASALTRIEFDAPLDRSALIPVADDIFEIYRERFAYDKTALNEEVTHGQDSGKAWRHERITIDAAYGGERLILHLFLPKTASAPYQTVIYFPGTGSLFQSSSDDITRYYEFPVFLSFLLKNGRAVVFPVYKGTFERRDESLIAHLPSDDSYAYAQWVTQMVKDFRRTVDYLETRPDIDSGKLAYYGMSMGGFLGALIPAVEDRLEVSLILAGGLTHDPRPEVNEVNYASRVKIPTLMMNGRYDTLKSFDASAQPMFELLGTPADDKALRVYETDHIPPMNEVIKESLDWLDRYLGPVHRSRP